MFLELQNEIKKQGKISIVEGIIFIIVGALIICNSFISSEVFTIILGILLLFLTLHAFKSAYMVRHKVWQMLGNILIGVLYAYLGISFIVNPMTGIISIALVIGWFYTFVGVYKLIVCIGTKDVQNKGLTIFSAILDLVLGVFLVLLWPIDSVIVISTIIAVEIMFTGIMLIVLGAYSLKA